MLELFNFYFKALAFKFYTVVELPQNVMFYLIMIFALCILVKCVCVLNKTKAMQVKLKMDPLRLSFLGKRTVNCLKGIILFFRDISIFIFIFLIFKFYYPLIFDGNVLEIYKICWLYLADVCLELTVMKLFLFLLCLNLLFSEGPINFCKLLFFLSLTVVPRMYLLSFFIIPEGDRLPSFAQSSVDASVSELAEILKK